MIAFIDSFHFLRPWLLTLLLPVAGLIGQARRPHHRRNGFQTLIAPHLLCHLLVGDRQRSRRLQPWHLLAAFWIVGVVALAGPAWVREPSPFAGDEAGLVIALKVAPDMMARDIQPSRLTRASQKIHDLLELRPGARTALIAYSGSSHLVMPFTTDSHIIDMFSQALSPDIMPTAGDDPVQALQQAADLLHQAAIPGSVLLIADALPGDELTGLKQFHQQTRIPVQLYAMAAPVGVQAPPGSPPAPALNRDALRQAAAALGADLTLVRADDGDVRQLARRIKTRMNATRQEQPGQHWRDGGYWLLPVLLMLALPFFRPGWVVTDD